MVPASRINTIFHRLTNRIDGGGNSVQFGYNNQGLLVVASNGNGQIIAVGYDALNRPTAITNADGLHLTIAYDLLNRPVTNTWPDSSTEVFIYATNGLLDYINQDHQLTQFARDGAGRITAITNNAHQVVQATYNALDLMASLTDGLSDSTTWQYNQFGLLTNKFNNLGANCLSNIFDANGRMTNRWMPATGNTAYQYDSVGNLTNIIYSQRTNAYKYDANRRLTNMVETVGADTLTDSYAYTGTGQLSTDASPWANSTITYTYKQGHRSAATLNTSPATLNNTYAYDAGWRLQTLASQAGAFTYGYLANSASGLPRAVSLPNQASIGNYFDSLARLDYTALLNYWGHPLDGYAYTSDAWGLRTNITRQLGLTTNIVTAGYDGIGELAL